MSDESRWLRSAHVIGALAIGGILFAVTLGKGVRDPDYFWHVTAGRWMVEHGRVPDADPFSFTWAGQPWTPHEWLTELLMYLLVIGVGELGALAVFALVPAATIVVLAVLLGRLGVRPIASVATLALAALVIAPYTTLRPQVLSWFLLAVTVAFLTSIRPDNRRRLVLLVPLFAIWANLHGLYIVGVAVVCAYALFTVFGRTQLAGHRRWAIGGAVMAFIGAMVTPAGPIGVLYPLRYSQEWGLANIQEWQSPNFHDPAHWPLLALVLVLFLVSGGQIPGWLRAVAFVGTLTALVAMRNSPVAAVLAAPALGLGLEGRLLAWRGPHRVTRRLVAARRAMEAVLAIVVVGAAAIIFIVPLLGQQPEAPLHAADYPVDAVAILEDQVPEARVMAEYGWGGYVIHELYDQGGRVFVDGRNDMYAEQILDDYSAVAAADEGWERIVDEYDVDALLFPPSRPIVKGLAQTAGWCEAHRDDASVLLLRECPPA